MSKSFENDEIYIYIYLYRAVGFDNYPLKVITRNNLTPLTFQIDHEPKS